MLHGVFINPSISSEDGGRPVPRVFRLREQEGLPPSAENMHFVVLVKSMFSREETFLRGPENRWIHLQPTGDPWERGGGKSIEGVPSDCGRPQMERRNCWQD